MTDQLRADLTDLMLIPGLSGHEDRVRKHIAKRLTDAGVTSSSDRMGNLIATFEGASECPSVMVFAHMDQLGLIVRKIEEDGQIRVHRLGGVPDRALLSQEVVLCGSSGQDIPGIIGNKSHHATRPEEKYQIPPPTDLAIDTGHASRVEVEAAGISIGTPVVYRPRVVDLANDRIGGTCVDDRAGCAVLLDIARTLSARKSGPTVYLVFSVQEEFNLRGAVVAAQNLQPDIAIQIDLMLATDTPDMASVGDMNLGGGPGISLYSFHGRGTLNGVIPHPSLVALLEETAAAEKIPLQRSAQVGVLTDLSYVQLVGQGVASLDVGFPMRYSHSSLEACDLGDLAALSDLLRAAIARIDAGFDLTRDGGT